MSRAGDGVSGCTLSNVLSALSTAYTTSTAQIACKQGQAVPYPVSAPGFVDDPTNKTRVCFLCQTLISFGFDSDLSTVMWLSRS